MEKYATMVEPNPTASPAKSKQTYDPAEAWAEYILSQTADSLYC